MRYLDASERSLSRSLWEEAFSEDSQQFGDYYFTEKIKDNQILVMEDSGRIDAMIQLNPYQLQVKNQQWKIDYLVGVATRKDRRHQGYMRRLLMRMMADMRAAQKPFCFLMPADEAIYRPFGFTFIYDQPYFAWNTEKKLEKQGLILWGSSADAETVEERDSWKMAEFAELMIPKTAEWMNQWLAEHFQVYAVRDQVYLERLLREIASEHGTLDLVFDENRLIGVQSFWGLEKKEQRLLYAEASYIKERKKAEPMIMARIIDVEWFMRVICLKDEAAEQEKTLLLQIEDPLIPQNDGIWKWVLNHESSSLEKWDAGICRPDLTLTITELTSWLFGYDIPSAAREADEVQPLQGVFLDEIV